MGTYSLRIHKQEYLPNKLTQKHVYTYMCMVRYDIRGGGVISSLRRDMRNAYAGADGRNSLTERRTEPPGRNGGPDVFG